MAKKSPEYHYHFAAAGLAAAMFFGLSELAGYWGGGLTPNPLWLATASTTALAAILPPKLRPVTVVGGAIGCIAAGLLLFDDSLRSLATPCLGNSAETIVAVFLLPRALTDQLSLDRTRRAIAWVGTSIVAAFLGATIATLDTSSQVIGERVESLLRWTLGDVIGLLLLPPLFVAFRSPWVTPRYRLWWLEAGVSGVVLVVLLLVAFNTNDPLPYVLVPVVMWIGIRFGPRLSAPIALLMALGSTYLTSQGRGPFAAIESDADAVVQVQALNLALALSSLVASAHAVRAWTDQQRLRATLESVPDVIVTLTDDGYREGSWGPPGLQTVVADLLQAERRETDDPLVETRSNRSSGHLLEHDSGVVLEHRTASVDDRLSLHLFRDVTAERRLIDSERDLEYRVDRARLALRQGLARDLHDGPLQHLVAAQLLIETTGRADSPDPELLRKAEHALDESTRQLRHSLDELARVHHDTDLIDSLASFGSDVVQAAGARFEINDHTERLRIEPDIRDALVLIGREAVLNAAVHSRASEVRIDLRHEAGNLELTITDDGVGVADSTGSDRLHFGILSMKARANERGGEVIIESNPRGGTVLRAVLPLLDGPVS